MQQAAAGRRGRARLVASLTTAVVALTGAVEVAAPAQARVPARQPAAPLAGSSTVSHAAARAVVAASAQRQKPHQVRAWATVTRHAAAHEGTWVRVAARVTATAYSHATRHGKPISTGRASALSHGSGHGTAWARAKAKARASGTAGTRKEAKQLARRRAVLRAERRAMAKAVLKARTKATHRAAGRARHTARSRALHRARHLARLRTIVASEPLTWRTWAPSHHTPRSGPLFNNPYGRKKARRSLLSHVISAIRSSPGYHRPWDPKRHRRAPCPSYPENYPSVIRIATYSIADGRFARALQAANRRCVSVQVLMNSHLTVVTSPSYGRIQRALGKQRRRADHQRSFAHRCSDGCLGTAVLHSKIYLFSRAGRARDVVMTGSSNMTKNAVGIQWNDLYTVNDNAKLFAQYRHMFGKMRPDRPERGPWVVRDGRYETYFYPFRRATSRTDLTMRALRSIRCTGARAPAGAHGHTVLYIAMHSWFEERGTYLARRVRQMYDHGCRVRILYSFVSAKIYRILTRGTGPRMQARRVLFAGASGLVASKYSHMKMFAASGRVGRNRSDWVVWTGSNNWTNKARHADEVTLRISSRSVYRAYVRRWKFMKKRRSSPVWALFEEPTGGGRAPAPAP